MARLRALGLFDSRVPRYTSYPTAPVFTAGVGADFQAQALAGLDPAEPVSVYVHIPFCERLCWFCACRTQGTKTMTPVEAYLEVLEAEIRQVVVVLHLFGLHVQHLRDVRAHEFLGDRGLGDHAFSSAR